MSDYTLEKVCELIKFNAVEQNYISLSDLVLFFLKKPDSLLCQAIQRSERNPDHIKNLILRFCPQSRKLNDRRGVFTRQLQNKIKQWKEDGISSEKELTKELLEDANILTYAISLINLPATILLENLEHSVIEGPIRINTPALNKGTNLTVKARRGELMPCIGREKEIRMIASVLMRMNKNFPVLIGEAGVGKTAVVEGFVQYLESEDAPSGLKGATVIEFPVSLFTAGHKYLGEVEKFATRLIEELKRSPDVILFLDEVHQVIGAGKAENQSADVAQIFKPVLARGEIKVIGATTLEEYMILEKDSAFERRMNPIRVEEPSKEESIQILKGTKQYYEDHHKISIPEDLLKKVVMLSHDYLTHRKLPDKAFDLLDNTCANVKTFRSRNEITERDVLETLVDMTGIEIASLNETYEDKISKLDKIIRKNVIGQDEAVEILIKRLKLAYGGFLRREKPLGVFLFLGYPGSGKTYLAKALAKNLFGDKKRFFRLDMSEYKDEISVNKLIGSAPGYVGYEKGGILTEFIKNNPFSVILLDEIEKANPMVADIFLALFGEGRITDNRGRTVDARNTICIMTSNHGIKKISKPGVGFLGELNQEQESVQLKKDLADTFRPEFLNRLDEVIVFNKLNRDDLKKIVHLQLIQLKKRLVELDINIVFEDNVKKMLAEMAYEMGIGARYVERIIEDQVLLPLSEKRLNGEIENGISVNVYLNEDRVKFKIERVI